MKIFCLSFGLIIKFIQSFLMRFRKPELFVRQVTEDDYEKVIAIRQGIYKGRDYLRTAYKKLIKLPENKGFCAIIRGEMVAYIMVTVINDQTTLVIRSIRINERYSKQGLTRQLILSVLKHYMLSTKVKLCWISFCQGYFYDKIYCGIFKPITVKGFILYEGNIHLPGSRENAKESRVQDLNVKELSDMFENKKMVKKLFPKECIVCLQIPFKPLVSNIPVMINGDQKILASNTEDVDITILSIGQWYSREDAIYYIDFYGNLARTEDLIDHLNRHVHICGKNVDGKIQIRVSIDECVNLDTINSYFRQMNFIETRHLLLFVAERKLRELRAVLS